MWGYGKETTKVRTLLFLGVISIGTPNEYVKGVFIDPKHQKEKAVPRIPGMIQSNPNEPIEDTLRRIDFQGDPNIEYIYKHNQEQSGVLSKREVHLIKKEEIDLDFIEEKLIQHGQALEHLIQMVKRNEEVTKKLLKNLSKLMNKPKLPAKVEVPRNRGPNRRSNTEKDDTELDENPILSGSSRLSRPNNGDIGINSGVKESLSWCENVLLCENTSDPLCGYDEKFGYGFFENVCHMMHVNCYWNYNFLLSPVCSHYNIE